VLIYESFKSVQQFLLEPVPHAQESSHSVKFIFQRLLNILIMSMEERLPSEFDLESSYVEMGYYRSFSQKEEIYQYCFQQNLNTISLYVDLQCT